MPSRGTLERSELLCIACGAVFTDDESVERCGDCGTEIDRRLIDRHYRYAFYALRYGYQYRKHYEGSGGSELKPYLAHLPDIFVFIAIAAVSGVVGNASWELVKAAARRINAQAAPGKRLDADEIEKLIRYVIDYTEGFSALPDAIRGEILEEMIGDAAAENLPLAGRFMDLLRRSDSEIRQRQAEQILRELVRRHKRRAQALPPRSSRGRFWGKIGGN